MQYHIKFLLLVLMGTVSLNAAIGQNNFVLTLGGGLNFTDLGANNLSDTLEITNTTYLGGGYQIDLGHLYFKEIGIVVHGMDTRLAFGQKFTSFQGTNGANFDLPDNTKLTLNSTYFHIGTTYLLGFKTSNGRILIDVLGINMGYLTAKKTTESKESGQTRRNIQNTGNSFLFGVTLPLGIHYVFNNGVMIGFRHRVDILSGGEITQYTQSTSGNDTILTPDKGSAFGTKDSQLSSLDYSLTFNIGYVIGK